MISIYLSIGLFVIVLFYKTYWIAKSIIAVNEPEKAHYRAKIINVFTISTLTLSLLVLYAGDRYNF